MKIAIIYPSFGVVATANQPNIKAVADNYGIYPNMSLAYVAGSLQAAGHDILFLDAMASGLSLNDMVEESRRFMPDLLMFTLTTYLFHESLEVIRLFRKKIKAKIIVGGAHLTLFAKETMRNREIDIGIIGEAEITVTELVDALEKKADLNLIKGLCFRDNGRVVITAQREKIKDIDMTPFPARNLLPMDKYYSFISKYKNYAIMITSRGCPFHCKFCEQRTSEVRYRSPTNVADEIEECITKYGVKEIDVFDPLFTINKKRVLGICREITDRKLKFAWSCRSRVDTIDEEMLSAMRKAGCYRIYFGIESGDERILKNIGKDTDTNKIRKAIRLTKKNGILAFGYFILGCPGETKESIEKTIELAKELPLDYAQFNRLSILPGTELYENVSKDMGYDYWREYILGKEKERMLPRVECSFSDEELNKYIKKAYLGFYMRPGFILRTVLRVRSPREFLRYVRAGFSMIKD